MAKQVIHGEDSRAAILRGVNQFRDLADRLGKKGFSPLQVGKILGWNFIRYAREIWGADRAEPEKFPSVLSSQTPASR